MIRIYIRLEKVSPNLKQSIYHVYIYLYISHRRGKYVSRTDKKANHIRWDD